MSLMPPNLVPVHLLKPSNPPPPPPESMSTLIHEDTSVASDDGLMFLAKVAGAAFHTSPKSVCEDISGSPKQVKPKIQTPLRSPESRTNHQAKVTAKINMPPPALGPFTNEVEMNGFRPWSNRRKNSHRFNELLPGTRVKICTNDRIGQHDVTRRRPGLNTKV